MKLDPGTRVTVEMPEESLKFEFQTKMFLNGRGVNCEKPRTEDGIYWATGSDWPGMIRRHRWVRV